MRRRPIGVYFWLGYLALAVIGIAVWFLSRVFGQSPQKDFITGIFGGLVGSIITLILAHVAYRQLYSLSSTASADFILKMKRDFFQEETRRLMHFVAEDWIEFVERDGSEFFRVKEAEVCGSELHQEIKVWLLKVKAYSAYDVDDLLLGHFEDLAMLWDDHILDINMIYDMFSWYIETAWRNCEIQKYVRNQRTEESPDIYDGFERLYDECRRIERSRNIRQRPEARQ